MATLGDIRQKIQDLPDGRKAYEEQDRIVKLGHLLRRARRARGMSQQTMATLCGINQADLSRLENGESERGPSTETLVKYARALDLNLMIALTERHKATDASATVGTVVGGRDDSDIDAPQIFEWERF